tara:strand:- start:4897 stop:5562 length:666 start_codon:yes stop_codon:yes gene_type:complete
MGSIRAEIVMLPTDDMVDNWGITQCIKEDHPICDYLGLYINLFNREFDSYKKQHLYFITDETIKKGDWCFNDIKGVGLITSIVSNTISTTWQDDSKTNDHAVNLPSFKKIVATTDSKLKVPKGEPYMSQDLMKVWVYPTKGLPKPTDKFLMDYCNKPINVVEIKCEHYGAIKLNHRGEISTLNPSLYSKYEIIDALQTYWDEVHGEGSQNSRLINWIDNNL